MEICFQGIGQVAATFQTEESELTSGMVVTMTENGIVGLGTQGDLPCGVSLGPARAEAVSVQISGVAKVNYSGATPPKAGYAMLACDGSGGVTTVTSNGLNCLVLTVDKDAHTAVIKL